MATPFAKLAIGQKFFFNGYAWIKRSRASATTDHFKGAYAFAETVSVLPA